MKASFIGKEKNELREAVDDLLAEGYAFWDNAGLPPISENDRYKVIDVAGLVYEGPHFRQFSAACQSFFLFRKLHNMMSEIGLEYKVHTLLGDYFFSQFSQNLIPLDSIPVIDAFAEYLKKDVCAEKTGKERCASSIGFNVEELADYIDFVKELPAVMKS